jgi:hypothetical protein
MFVGAEAAVFVIVVMLVGSLSDGEWQQGKRQSKQQTAHGKAPEMKVLLCDLITIMPRVCPPAWRCASRMGACSSEKMQE